MEIRKQYNESGKVENPEKKKDFLEWLRSETKIFRKIARVESSDKRGAKSGTEFEGMTTQDIEEMRCEKKEEMVTSIYHEMKEEGIISVTDKLLKSVNVFDLSELSELSTLIGSIILELDDSSLLKQKLLKIQEELKAIIRLKTLKK